MKALRLCALLGLLPLCGCSALTLINALSPDRHYTLVEDLPYGSNPRQRLDLALPGNGPPKALIVFIYGGGWTSGHRQDYHFVIDAFARRGFAVALPDYRVYPEVGFPTFVEDAATAVAYLQAHASDLGVGDLPLFLMGHSAGAHIGAMLNFDERYLRAAGVDPAVVRGFVGLAGPYDFLPLSSATLKRVFGPPCRYAASQPVNFVDGNEAPILLLQGEADHTVWPRNTRRLAQKFSAAGGQVETHFYPGLGHVRILLSLSSSFAFAPVIETSVHFINTTLAAAGAAPAIRASEH